MPESDRLLDGQNIGKLSGLMWTKATAICCDAVGSTCFDEDGRRSASAEGPGEAWSRRRLAASLDPASSHLALHTGRSAQLRDLNLVRGDGILADNRRTAVSSIAFNTMHTACCNNTHKVPEAGMLKNCRGKSSSDGMTPCQREIQTLGC